MRKILLSIAVLLVAGISTSQAQILKLGIIGGANTHTLEFSSVQVGDATLSQVADNQYGYQVGAALRISLPDFLQIQTELIFRESNSRLMVSNGSIVNTSMSMQSIELPVMVGFNIKSFRVFAGPVFNISSNMIFTQKYNTISAKMKDNTGIQAGMGFDIGKFFFDARYTYYSDPTQIAINVNGDSGTIKCSKDNSFQLNIGLFF